MESRFTILLIEVGVAVGMQIIVLLAILISLRKTGKRMEILANDVQRRIGPTLDNVQALVEHTRPRVEMLVTNVAESSTLLKVQAEKLDSTLSDIMDRTRRQVVRADDFVSRTFDKVETASETVQTTVNAPVRQLSAILQAVSTGIGVFLGRSRRSRNGATQQDELFV